MSEEDPTDETSGDRAEDESGHTGHDKYRPIDVRTNSANTASGRRDSGRNVDGSESESVGRDSTGTRRYGTAGAEREGHVGRDDAHRAASERHRSGRGGRPSDDRHYDSRDLQQGRSSGNPHTGSQRGSHREEGIAGRLGGHRGGYRTGPGDDQDSLGDQYRYGGERGGSQRDRRYGSRRGNSTQRDPRRE